MMNRQRSYRGAGALLAAALGVTTACADTEIQGVVLNEDLDTPELMIGLARGTNSEFADIYLASQIQWFMNAASDDHASDGTTSSEEAMAVADFSDRPQESLWGQSHEAVWAVLFTDKRMKEVFEPEVYATTPLLARNYVYGGHAEKILGEYFEEIIYNYGKDGGIFLENSAEGIYDPGERVPPDSAFRRAIYMFERALQFAEAGVAAGVEPPEGDPLFDPAQLVHAAHAGLAQTYLNLGDYVTAADYASRVPDNFVDLVLMDGQVDGGNDVADFFFENDDMNLYGSPAGTLYADDPRVAMVKCGDWAGENLENSPSTPPSSAFTRLECGNNGEYRSESNRYPLWISTKYPDDDADIEVASGAEMRLIEAEAALVAGNLGEFKAQVDRARAVYGLGPIPLPTTAGALEFPNAQDDAWSILDRERYLELFLEGRRFGDLVRWEHPFITEDHVLLPRLAAEMAPSGRWLRLPLPERECRVNSQINCPVLTP